MKPRTAFYSIAAYESSQAIFRFEDRQRAFKAAEDRARQLNRPLVVVGAPSGGAHTRLIPAYSCGDITVDLNASALVNCRNPVVADITHPGAIPVADGEAVVFVSCVLEYVNDPVAAYNECLRAAGSADNLFIVRVQPYTITSVLYPGAKWSLHPQPNGWMRFSPITSFEKLIVGGSVAWLTYAAWKQTTRPAVR